MVYLGQTSCPHCSKNVQRVDNLKEISESDSFVFKYFDLSNMNLEEREYLKNAINLEIVPSLIIINSKTKVSKLFSSEELLDEEYEKRFKKTLKGDLKYE